MDKVWLTAELRRTGLAGVRGLRALTAGILVIGLASPLLPAPPAQAASAPAGLSAVQQARTAYDRLPLAFAPNAGQTDPSVRYLAQSPGAAVFLTDRTAVLALSPVTAGGDGLALRMQFAATAVPQLTAADALPGKVNYLNGDAVHTSLPTHSSVTYANVQPGIDLIFSGTPGRLRSTLSIAPGADLAAFAVRYEGADGVVVDALGALVLHTAGGELHSPQPAAWQEIGGERRPVEARYVLRGDGRVGLELGPHDAAYKIEMEPEILYATYLGGNDSESGRGITVDAWGNAYVTGETRSPDFPVTAGSFQRLYGGNNNEDAFVTKLRRDGTALLYSTYLGGSDDDAGRGIKVDRWGNAYVTGHTESSNFPVTAGAYQPHNAGGPGTNDAFITKLSRDGSALVYSTYLGGTDFDRAADLDIDGWGNAYVTGVTNSTDFPTKKAFQPDYGGGDQDAFVTKLNPRGTALVYSTYLGGTRNDNGEGIAVDHWGKASVTGSTNSPDFPTTSDAFQPDLNGSQDAFVTKFTAGGTGLVYSTYLGGSDNDLGIAIAVDGWGRAYVTGTTPSTDFPTTPGAFQENHGGGIRDAFVTKFTADGSALVYSTYLGGNGHDFGSGIAVGEWGHAYVTGFTESTDFPTEDAFQTMLQGSQDAFVTKFTDDGSDLVYSSYLGGSAFENGNAIAVDKQGNAYVTGQTSSSDFPFTPGAFQRTLNGGNDAYVAKIGEDSGYE